MAPVEISHIIDMMERKEEDQCFVENRNYKNEQTVRYLLLTFGCVSLKDSVSFGTTGSCYDGTNDEQI